jgi:hypothetical protein
MFRLPGIAVSEHLELASAVSRPISSTANCGCCIMLQNGPQHLLQLGGCDMSVQQCKTCQYANVHSHGQAQEEATRLVSSLFQPLDHLNAACGRWFASLLNQAAHVRSPSASPATRLRQALRLRDLTDRAALELACGTASCRAALARPRTRLQVWEYSVANAMIQCTPSGGGHQKALVPSAIQACRFQRRQCSSLRYNHGRVRMPLPFASISGSGGFAWAGGSGHALVPTAGTGGASSAAGMGRSAQQQALSATQAAAASTCQQVAPPCSVLPPTLRPALPPFAAMAATAASAGGTGKKAQPAKEERILISEVSQHGCGFQVSARMAEALHMAQEITRCFAFPTPNRA